ncbi:acyl- thioesterase protein [Rutstroemia sp. NJR-2017a WRK4]|nr:acyl- thioesterase protein [Rutstroemia sp. NJR-2017a WRK4]
MHNHNKYRNGAFLIVLSAVFSYIYTSLFSSRLPPLFTYAHVANTPTTPPTMDPKSHTHSFIIPPKSLPHTTSLILLHGTSTNGESFGSALLEPFLSPSSEGNVTLADLLPHAKFVFPSGRERRTTVLGGNISNAWFDIWDFADRTKGEEAQKEGLRESIEYLGWVIKEEVERLPAEGKVVIGGFSQGSAMSVFLLLSGELERLGVRDRVVGLVGWSGWLPFRRQIEEVAGMGEGWRDGRRRVGRFVRRLVGLGEGGRGKDGEGDGEEYIVGDENEEDRQKDEGRQTDGNSQEEDGGQQREGVENISEDGGLKVWLGHGIKDEKVLLEWGTQMRDVLTTVGYDVSWNEYEGLGHWYLPGELEDMVRFIEEMLRE